MKSSRWSKRVYELDGVVIPSSGVAGFLHKARFEKTCMMCGEVIPKGVKYIQLNIINADPLHVECYAEAEEPLTLGVKIEKRHGGYKMQTYVVCKRWMPPFNADFYKNIQID
jgi:hypothetical protein